MASYTDEAGNTIGYIYDPASNLIQITYPDGRAVNYGYDQNNRLSSVTDCAGRVTTYQYDNNGRLILTSRPDGTQETRSYDASGMLTSINDTAPWGTIYADSITIDAAGRTTAENETAPVQPFNVPAAFSATYDADNRISAVNGTAVTFDADGNMLSGPAPGTLTNTGYSYNARNQPIEAGGFAYTYGVLGNRIAVQSPFNSFTTFVVDPNAALDRVLSRTVSGPSGATTTYYIYGLGLIGEETNGAYAAYHFDSRGSTVALTDINANLTDSFSYGPYGELNNHTGSSTTPFQYNGQFGVQTDPDGLFYMRARYYNPAIRRFVNQDVLFGNIDPGISLNRFAFANGDPVDGIDPFGLHALVLNNSNGVPVFGHSAILVGTDQTGWQYFSKNGPGQLFTNGPEAGDNSSETFPTRAAFFASQEGRQYDRAILIPTTDAQDASMKAYDMLMFHNRVTFCISNYLVTLTVYGISFFIPSIVGYAFTVLLLWAAPTLGMLVASFLTKRSFLGLAFAANVLALCTALGIYFVVYHDEVMIVKSLAVFIGGFFLPGTILALLIGLWIPKPSSPGNKPP